MAPAFLSNKLQFDRSLFSLLLFRSTNNFWHAKIPESNAYSNEIHSVSHPLNKFCGSFRARQQYFVITLKYFFTMINNDNINKYRK